MDGDGGSDALCYTRICTFVRTQTLDLRLQTTKLGMKRITGVPQEHVRNVLSHSHVLDRCEAYLARMNAAVTPTTDTVSAANYVKIRNLTDRCVREFFMVSMCRNVARRRSIVGGKGDAPLWMRVETVSYTHLTLPTIA